MRPGFGREGVAVTMVVHIKKCSDHRVARIFRKRECFPFKTACALPCRCGVDLQTDLCEEIVTTDVEIVDYH